MKGIAIILNEKGLFLKGNTYLLKTRLKLAEKGILLARQCLQLTKLPIFLLSSIHPRGLFLEIANINRQLPIYSHSLVLNSIVT